MATRKTSVSLTDEALAAAGEAASRAGLSVSAWLSRAAREQAWREKALAVADELHQAALAASGPLSPADERWVAETLARTTRTETNPAA